MNRFASSVTSQSHLQTRLLNASRPDRLADGSHDVANAFVLELLRKGALLVKEVALSVSPLPHHLIAARGVDVVQLVQVDPLTM